VASKPVPIRFTDEELARIDRHANGTPRATWIKARLREVCVAHESGVVQLPAASGEVIAIDRGEVVGVGVAGDQVRSLGLTGDASRRPAGGMVVQPRPIVQKRSKGKS
jgi:hypothetical protein